MSPLDGLRRPAHTGANRCRPCTVLNLLTVAACAFLVGRRRRSLGAALAAVGVALVWARGYVVPYTPTFAPRLVAASPLPTSWFHGETATDPGSRPPGDRSAPGSMGDTGPAGGEELLERLVEAGALVADREGVRLDPTFEEAWHAEMAPLAAADTGSLAAAVDEALDDATASVVEGVDDERVVLDDGAVWLSRPVAVAELAAVRALNERLPAATARRAAGPLRMFLADCPDCGAPVVETTTASCCGGYTTPRSVPDEVLACQNCGVRLFTFDE
jgi:hypothetical protein